MASISSGGSCRSPSNSTQEFLVAISMPLRNATKNSCVLLDGGILGRNLHAAAECGLRSEIARVRNAAHAPVILRYRADHFFGIVRAAVVDENDLMIDIQFCEGGLQALIHN